MSDETPSHNVVTLCVHSATDDRASAASTIPPDGNVSDTLSAGTPSMDGISASGAVSEMQTVGCFRVWFLSIEAVLSLQYMCRQHHTAIGFLCLCAVAGR